MSLEKLAMQYKAEDISCFLHDTKGKGEVEVEHQKIGSKLRRKVCHKDTNTYLVFSNLNTLSVGTLNLNGTREGQKRFTLFGLIKLKQVHVMFV